jgi:hypothetical protein
VWLVGAAVKFTPPATFKLEEQEQQEDEAVAEQQPQQQQQQPQQPQQQAGTEASAGAEGGAAEELAAAADDLETTETRQQNNKVAEAAAVAVVNHEENAPGVAVEDGGVEGADTVEKGPEKDAAKQAGTATENTAITRAQGATTIEGRNAGEAVQTSVSSTPCGKEMATGSSNISDGSSTGNRAAAVAAPVAGTDGSSSSSTSGWGSPFSWGKSRSSSSRASPLDAANTPKAGRTSSSLSTPLSSKAKQKQPRVLKRIWLRAPSEEQAVDWMSAIKEAAQ